VKEIDSALDSCRERVLGSKKSKRGKKDEKLFAVFALLAFLASPVLDQAGAELSA
jgi:hypothetical protein